MSFDQIAALAVLVAVVGGADLGQAALRRGGAVRRGGPAAGWASIRPVEVQGAFASPAIIALGLAVRHRLRHGAVGPARPADPPGHRALRPARRGGPLAGDRRCAAAASAFLNNTPIVVLAAPVVRDVAESLNLSPKRFLIPLSYVTILGGACTLIGTSTNLLVNDMARNAGQPVFGMFEITPVALIIAAGRRPLSVPVRRPPAGAPTASEPDAAPQSARADRRDERDRRRRRACSPRRPAVRAGAGASSSLAVFAGGGRGRGARARADRGRGLRRRGAADPAAGDQRRGGLHGPAAGGPAADRRHGGGRPVARGDRPGRRRRPTPGRRGPGRSGRCWRWPCSTASPCS